MTIVGYPTEHSMDSRSRVNLTPKSKFKGQRSNFQQGPMDMKFDRDDI